MLAFGRRTLKLWLGNRLYFLAIIGLALAALSGQPLEVSRGWIMRPIHILEVPFKTRRRKIRKRLCSCINIRRGTEYIRHTWGVTVMRSVLTAVIWLMSDGSVSVWVLIIPGVSWLTGVISVTYPWLGQQPELRFVSRNMYRLYLGALAVLVTDTVSQCPGQPAAEACSSGLIIFFGYQEPSDVKNQTEGTKHMTPPETVRGAETGETVGKRLGRKEIADKLAEFDKAAQHGPSQRQLADELEIPRSTLQHWLSRRDSVEAAPELTAFFESPAGAVFLRRLVLAAHFVMTLVGPCGIRPVCLFLELTGVDRFVAASYGSHRKVSVAMENCVAEFGTEEKKRLAEGMEPKKITVCEDETFHPEPCLVAIEPVSNFIVLEKYSSGKKADEWTDAVNKATEGIPAEIIQSVSDEARGIIHHVENDFGAHHSPDLFHVQQDIVRGTAVALESKIKKAENVLKEAVREVSRLTEEKEAYFSGKPGPGRPPRFDKRIEDALKKEDEAGYNLDMATERREHVKELIRGISDDYHPYDLETGMPKSAEGVASSLKKKFSEIEDAASDANLSENCIKKIKKAERVITKMTATTAFFFLTVRAKTEALSLPPEAEEAVYNNLIPGIYLRLVSEKTKDREQRQVLRKKSEELLAPVRSGDGPFSCLEKGDALVAEQVAKECANLFQRSSSCVEGRNGQLALRHHSLHRISNRKLAALTEVHNFFAKRSDGTTAAERFFGAKPDDMFEYLVERVDIPARPAQRRPQPEQKEYLLQNAA